LLKNTPGVFRAAVHDIAELLPLLLGLSTSVSAAGICGRSGHVVAGLISLGLLLSGESVTVNIHGDDFSEVTIRVVSQVVRISQDGLHRVVASRENIHLLSLLHEEILKRASVLIEDARGLDAEVVNDLGGYGAYARLPGRRSLRGSLGL